MVGKDLERIDNNLKTQIRGSVRHTGTSTAARKPIILLRCAEVVLYVELCHLHIELCHSAPQITSGYKKSYS